MRGVRFNFVKRLVDPKPDAYYLRLVERIAPFGWHIVIYFEAADLAERWEFFTSLPTTVVVDHMGRPDVTKPIDGPEFGLFVKLMAEHPEYLVEGELARTAVGDRSAELRRRRALRAPHRRVIPRPGAVGHRLAAPESEDATCPTTASWSISSRESRRHQNLQRQLLVDNPMRLYWEGE